MEYKRKHIVNDGILRKRTEAWDRIKFCSRPDEIPNTPLHKEVWKVYEILYETVNRIHSAKVDKTINFLFNELAKREDFLQLAKIMKNHVDLLTGKTEHNLLSGLVFSKIIFKTTAEGIENDLTTAEINGELLLSTVPHVLQKMPIYEITEDMLGDLARYRKLRNWIKHNGIVIDNNVFHETMTGLLWIINGPKEYYDIKRKYSALLALYANYEDRLGEKEIILLKKCLYTKQPYIAGCAALVLFKLGIENKKITEGLGRIERITANAKAKQLSVQ